MRGRSVALAAFAVSGLVVASCAEDRNDLYARESPRGKAPLGGTAVNGIEKQWVVGIDLDVVKAGPVTFTFKNIGTIPHEMLVVRTDLPVGGLPVDPTTRRFNEESPAWEVLDEISEYSPDEIDELTLDLEPGNYQLVCNIEGHYKAGMATAFQVKA